ncbi:hypothetical protein [Sinosporangium siamense]|uniref:Uncharacterized protein n=1 Tax=Sinosporangium siamense TaxID=1367973 RepID=A0A919V7I6_9ACTN|nr:hypothetical protein [Sinosporangium siamense]GII95160.1 hypothetical protein Ssi02_53910 [Sinosporangium siamense]
MPLSPGGRRLHDPVPRWMSGFGVVVVLAYAGALAAAPAVEDLLARRVFTAKVEYEVTGNGLADVETALPARRRLTGAEVPLKRRQTLHRGQEAVVTASGVGGAIVGCRLTVDGVLVAADAGQRATCAVTVGDTAAGPPEGTDDVPATGEIAERPRFEGRTSPVEGRLTDPEAGLSYARLGGAWGPPRGGEDTPVVAGGALTLWRHSLPERGWFSAYGSGLLNPGLLYHVTPEKDLFPAALAQQDALTRLATPGCSYRDLASHPLTVGGRPAWLITREVTLSPEANSTVRSEINTLVLIDTGDVRPAYFFVTMASPAHDHLPDMKRLVSSLRVI